MSDRDRRYQIADDIFGWPLIIAMRDAVLRLLEIPSEDDWTLREDAGCVRISTRGGWTDRAVVRRWPREVQAQLVIRRCHQEA